MTPQELKDKLLQHLPEADVEVVDLTGTHDHYSVTICDKSFEGLLPIKRHRMINEILRDELKSGEIHALQLNTITEDERK